MRLVIAFVLCSACFPQTGAPPTQPVRAVTDPGVVTTRQSITPAGIPTVFQGRVYGAAFGADSSELYVLHATHVYRLDWKANRVVESVAHGGSPGLQGIRFDGVNGQALFSTARPGTGGRNGPRRVGLLAFRQGAITPVAKDLGSVIAGSIAIASQPNAKGQRLAVVPLIRDNKLAIVDLAKGETTGSVPASIAPFGAAINRDGSLAWVTNWGGRLPTANDLTATTGMAADADRVVVDQKGIASTGVVTRIDLRTNEATHTVAVELHPTAILWDEPRARLYITNGNSSSVSVIDTKTNKVAGTYRVQPFQQDVTGIAPTALAISPDGQRLFVACGGINAVAVLKANTGALEGLIPTGWYPNGLAVSPDGRKLAVTSLLGAGSGWRDAPAKRYVHAYRGSVQVLEFPDEAQLNNYSTAVAENNRLPLRGAATARVVVKPRSRTPVAIPERAGEPSPIEHVVYIVKENRTYDQVFGDMKKGNGDESLVMFGEDVTPNHHRLADQFVLLDNFYATGGNSGDGHQWVTQADETDYCLWPGYAGRSYPFDGSDPIAYAQGGFLWDAALKQNKTVRIYGEYAGRSSEPNKRRLELLEKWKAGEDFSTLFNTVAPIAALNKILAKNYPAYTNSVPDVVRAQLFLTDLKGWSNDGKMPNLTIVQLPSDHTFGASPGTTTPASMVADNDLALGQIVEGLTKSRFWPKMAIFVVEDDAQNGVDHVDGHRTVALAISPYIRRGTVDSTFYSHQSILKTIELILGLPTLSLFDLIANDMRAGFQNEADTSPYTSVLPKQSLTDLNPPSSALRGRARQAAIASSRMRWDVPDAAPSDELNRILWHQTRGWSTPFPGIRRAVFAPLAVELEDSERATGTRPAASPSR